LTNSDPNRTFRADSDANFTFGADSDANPDLDANPANGAHADLDARRHRHFASAL
jgi:hypothetical protein